MLQKTHKYATCLSLRSLRCTIFKVISEFTQQDDRKKRMAERLSVTNGDERERDRALDRARPFALVDHVINF